MYLLKRDYDHAIDYFRELQQRFPTQTARPSPLEGSWLSFRQGRPMRPERIRRSNRAVSRLRGGSERLVLARAYLAEEENDPGTWRGRFIRNFPTDFATIITPNSAATLESPAWRDGRRVAQGRRAPLRAARPRSPLSTAERSWPPILPTTISVSTGASAVEWRPRRSGRARIAGGGQPGRWNLGAPENGARLSGRLAATIAASDHEALDAELFAVDIPDLPRPYWEALFPKAYWTDLRKYSLLNGLILT